jgi:CubicO group peptidase (beta-lactamase class C family)
MRAELQAAEQAIAAATLDRRRLLAGLGAAALAAATTPRAAFARTGGYSALEALLDQYVEAGRVPGAVIAIVKPGRFRPDYISNGTMAFPGNAGFPDRRVGPDTLWRIYSMTKPVTGMAVMQQVALGRLTLDTPVGDILPEYRQLRVLVDPDKNLESRPGTQPMRVRHLLTHTAGLTYHIAGDGPLEREYRRLGLLPIGNLGRRPGDGDVGDLDAFTKTLATLPLRTEPGTAYRYSVGLDLAGGLLQRLTGQPLDRVFDTQLLKPLGMGDTGFTVPAGALGRLASLYAYLDPKTFKPTDTPGLADAPPKSQWARPAELLAGGAGLVSSAADYARFAHMLLNEGDHEGGIAMPRGVARLATSNLLPPGLWFEKVNGYGAGGSVQLSDTRALPYGTPPGVYGWGGAAGTLFQVDPVRQVAVVLMLNYLPVQHFPMGRDWRQAINRDLPGF